MKIALITIHNANNYGAALQAYATKKILSQYGEVTTIDYDNRFLNHHLDLIRFERSIHGAKMLIHDLLRLKYRVKAIGKFKKFINSNMNLSKKITDEELMEGKAGKFDIYVCGSDQIWNPEITSSKSKIDSIFFLNFAEKKAKKISYASSMGNHNYSKKEKEEVKYLLEDFSLITIRENDGVKKIKEILPKKNIHHILDPTLFLSQEEWLKTLNIQLKKPKKNYILLYSVPRSQLIKKAVDFFSKRFNMEVITIDQMFFPITKVNKHIRDAGPKDFIELFTNASFIITDSFHVTCFALNFSKPFVSVSSGIKSNRVLSLLKLLNITKRMVKSESEFKNIDLTMNFENIHSTLNSEKVLFLSTLKKELSSI